MSEQSNTVTKVEEAQRVSTAYTLYTRALAAIARGEKRVERLDSERIVASNKLQASKAQLESSQAELAALGIEV